MELIKAQGKQDVNTQQDDITDARDMDAINRKRVKFGRYLV